jgi:predicted component of type VI protein secretion system
MSAQLVALTDGRIIQVDKAILVVGRHAECDVQILSPKISRMHCCIAQVGDHLVVRDLNSTNGIRVNGVRMIEGRLAAGDELAIGTHRYQVRGDGLAVKSPAPRAASEMPASKRQPKGVATKDLESCDVPVALPEPDAPFRRKAKEPPSVRPLPEPEDATEGPVEPPLVELVEVEAPPVVEVPPPGPPPPSHLELVSSSDEFQNPSAHPAP